MPDDPIIPAAAPEPLPAADENNNGDETDEILETLHADGIVDARRHDQLVEIITECREQLRQISNREQTESPMLVSLQTQVSELQSRLETALTELRTLLEQTRTPPQPQPNPSSQPPSESSHRSQTAAESATDSEHSTSGHVRVEQPQPQPVKQVQKRVLKI